MFRWTPETYQRRSVDQVKHFCGWDTLLSLVERARTRRDQGFVAALFETGGRVSEVLQLTPRNFIPQEEEDVIIVQSMMVLKKYRKIGEYIDEEGTKRWKTRRIEASRTFAIYRPEPLVPPLEEWIGQVSPQLRLFRFGRKRAYQIISELGDDVYPHWFRAQRASQLSFEYGFAVPDLVEFFTWKHMETALRYSHMGWRGLVKKYDVRKLGRAITNGTNGVAQP